MLQPVHLYLERLILGTFLAVDHQAIGAENHVVSDIADEEDNRGGRNLAPPAIEQITYAFERHWNHPLLIVSSELLFHLRGQAKVLAKRMKGTNFVKLRAQEVITNPAGCARAATIRLQSLNGNWKL